MSWFALAFAGLTVSQSICAQGDLSRLVEKTTPAIVLLEGQGPAGSKQGAGFFVSADGLTVTNLHVIAGLDRLRVRIGTSQPIEVRQVLAFDEARDIALIKVPAERLPRLLLADSGKVKAGQPVIALGSPFGLGGTASQGIVSAVRELPGTVITVIHTDASVNPGTSGGPLLNSRGEVIGVITAKLRGSEGLTFAVPSNDIRTIVKGARAPMSLLDLNRAIKGSGRPSEAAAPSIPPNVRSSERQPL
jgi:serine protease Do